MWDQHPHLNFTYAQIEPKLGVTDEEWDLEVVVDSLMKVLIQCIAAVEKGKFHVRDDKERDWE